MITTDFFYNTYNRGLPGLNWGANPSLSAVTRACRDSISISEKDVRGNQDLIVSIYYRSKVTDVQTFKGEFRMEADKVREWVLVNGYYTRSDGKKFLAIPVNLWEQTKKSEKQILSERQPTLL